jgi:hypothetical protein
MQIPPIKQAEGERVYSWRKLIDDIAEEFHN